MDHPGKPWVSDFNHANYNAGKAAMFQGALSVDTTSLLRLASFTWKRTEHTGSAGFPWSFLNTWNNMILISGVGRYG